VIPIVEEGAGDLEIILTNGHRLRVPAQVSVEALRRVVDVLRTAC
jgi:hypothetical protein